MQETQVPSLGQEDTLEKEMTTHSSILAWEFLWTEEPGRLHTPVHGVHKELDMTAQLNNNHSLSGKFKLKPQWHNLLYNHKMASIKKIYV